MDLSVELIQTFICVAEERSFSKAAYTLRKSQSSVSTQIKLLEEQLKSRLLDRSRHPPKLTEAGEAVYQYAKEVLNRTRDLERDLHELSSGVSGEVRVGAISSISTYLLLPTIGRLLRVFPSVKISILNQSRFLLFESVRTGAVDFAIVLSDREPENLCVKIIRSEQLCVVRSPKAPARKLKELTIGDLSALSFVLGLEGSEYTKMIDRLLKEMGLKQIKVSMRISNWEGIKEAVRADIGLAILPHFAVERELRDHTLQEMRIKEGALMANIMVLENPNRYVSSPTVSHMKAELVSAIAGKASH
jgi:DNA-binding transcriptional LysR family regulator